MTSEHRRKAKTALLWLIPHFSRYPPITPDPRILFLLNPGRQSRYYLLGLAGAARRLGFMHLTLEIHEVWNRLAAGPAELQKVQSELAALMRQHRITHSVGYAWNGALDFGLLRDAGGGVTPLLPALGIKHLLFWTDHPNWFMNGNPIEPSYSTHLAHPGLIHFLKSPGAAAEAQALLRWHGVHALPMAEDYAALRAQPTEPIHDAVAIVGATQPLPPATAARLADDNPDPAEIDAALLPAAIERLTAWGNKQGISLSSFGAALLQAKVAAPLETLFALAQPLAEEHAATYAWLTEDPRRWFAAAAILRTMVGWRRNFYLAWLSRRMNVGIYGASSAPLGIPQLQGADAWVPYAEQANIYARGRIALNTNASHDEQGCTHKPFQIAAAARTCLHHETRGFHSLFSPSEASTFSTASELLNHAQSICSSNWEQRGHAMLARAQKDHTWDLRLVEMLKLAAPGASPGVQPVDSPAAHAQTA